MIWFGLGRKVDTEEILQHELFNVPLSLAKTNGDIYIPEIKLV